MKSVLAIRHVAFEDLDAFAPVLAERGYAIRYLEAGYDDLAALDPLADELLVVLGGPIGVYEDGAYRPSSAWPAVSAMTREIEPLSFFEIYGNLPSADEAIE
jgi:GMP synthase-like glutamine amidotransferase